jgi:phosphate starvation-inducible protein PhoH and related proteins
VIERDGIARLVRRSPRLPSSDAVHRRERGRTTLRAIPLWSETLGLAGRADAVVTGDITQVDLPRDQKSGLIVVNDILDGVDGLEFVNFGGEDVVRHKLVQRIVAAYDEHSKQAAQELRPAERRRTA